MGNTLGGKKVAKVMKIDGQTMKFKTPVYANEVLKDYPGLVLLESESVKHFGIRAKPLEPQMELKGKRLYFLVELPKFPEEKGPRRVRSGIQMTAKDRLETLMLARRSTSDLTIMKPPSIASEESSRFEQTLLVTAEAGSGTLTPTENGGGPVRLKLRLPKGEVEKLMMQSKDEGEAAEKIMRLYMANNNNNSGALNMEGQKRNNINNGGIIKKGIRSNQKRVGFLPITEGELQLAVAAS